MLDYNEHRELLDFTVQTCRNMSNYVYQRRAQAYGMYDLLLTWLNIMLLLFDNLEFKLDKKQIV